MNISFRDATGVVLHKDSRWYKQWKEFSENNQVFTKIVDLKMKFDESDNVLVRASRAVTDRVSQLLGGMFSPTEMSEVLTEILKIDPSFTKESFLKMCEQEIIPNILEAMIRGDMEILKDWCYEAPYSQLSTPIKQAKAMGLQFDSKILDVDSIELSMGKMMEQGPVLVITFVAQQIMAVRNMKGEVVEGDPEKVMRVTYVWVLCRDQETLDPRAAWRLLDLSANSAQQWV
ncbi:Mitochondrial import inner membrane translocase subunit TIM44 [Holothuria leucospilota]|uniref:Mitochondrial import inner membrane translocase subunit TIM44 n=1 Tax=Holothuria leucospilota TaxID=206669 RepID=A0A9Q1C943_HOLLE|nr:Mitochondrial import inner membrane translocase subunit TIM44 [Holothuria leucospilota]